jgi:hypothetical protein
MVYARRRRSGEVIDTSAGGWLEALEPPNDMLHDDPDSTELEFVNYA